MASSGTPEARLLAMITALTRNYMEDQVSSKLLQREVLDADEERLQWLSEHLFERSFTTMSNVLAEIGPRENSDLMTIYLSALVAGYYSFAPILQKIGDGAYLTDPEELSHDIAMHFLGRQQQVSI